VPRKLSGRRAGYFGKSPIELHRSSHRPRGDNFVEGGNYWEKSSIRRGVSECREA
jgi:hypothetical protein